MKLYLQVTKIKHFSKLTSIIPAFTPTRRNIWIFIFFTNMVRFNLFNHLSFSVFSPIFEKLFLHSILSTKNDLSGKDKYARGENN